METTLSLPTNTFKEKGLTNPVDSTHPSREKSLVPKKASYLQLMILQKLINSDLL